MNKKRFFSISPRVLSWLIILCLLFFDPVSKLTPFREIGHRIYTFSDKSEHQLMIDIAGLCDLTVKDTRVIGGDTQVLMDDWQTVFMLSDTIKKPGISFACSNPKERATEIVRLMRSRGYNPIINEDYDPAYKGKIFLIEDEKFSYVPVTRLQLTQME